MRAFFVVACLLVLATVAVVMRCVNRQDHANSTAELGTFADLRSHAQSAGCPLLRIQDPNDLNAYVERCEKVLDGCGCVLTVTARGERRNGDEELVVKALTLNLSECPTTLANSARDSVLVPMIATSLRSPFQQFTQDPVPQLGAQRSRYRVSKTRMFGNAHVRVQLAPGKERYAREIEITAAERLYPEIEDIRPDQGRYKSPASRPGC